MHIFFRMLLLLWLGIQFNISAQTPPPDRKFSYENIGKKVTWFEDKTASVPFPQIQILDQSGKFRQGKREILNFGNSSSAFWIKIRYIPQRDSELYLIVDAPNIEHIDYYTFEANGAIRHTKSGCLSFETAGISIQNNFSFKLPKGQVNQERTVYLRLKTNNILVVPLKLATPDMIMKGRAFKDRIEYIYIGVLMALLIFNLFLFVSLKDITYLYYTLYVLTLSAYLLIYIRGYGFLFGEECRILFNRHPHVLLSLSVITSLLFCKKFLNL